MKWRSLTNNLISENFHQNKQKLNFWTLCLEIKFLTWILWIRDDILVQTLDLKSANEEHISFYHFFSLMTKVFCPRPQTPAFAIGLIWKTISFGKLIFMIPPPHLVGQFFKPFFVNFHAKNLAHNNFPFSSLFYENIYRRK